MLDVMCCLRCCDHEAAAGQFGSVLVWRYREFRGLEGPVQSDCGFGVEALIVLQTFDEWLWMAFDSPAISARVHH